MSQMNPEAGECQTCEFFAVFDYIDRNNPHPQIRICTELCQYWIDDADDIKHNECGCWSPTWEFKRHMEEQT